MRPATDALGAYVGGFVAAEGSFVKSRGRFRFSVGLGAADTQTCLFLRDYLGCGNVFRFPRRRAHYDDEITFAIQSLIDHVEITIPFMDEHLPPSYKRQQYVAWRAALLDYWEHDARRVRACSVDGCDRPRRANGLCRHHLYAATGR